MSQRDSGYERKERDCYETPEWVTLALVPHLPRPPRSVWEPACGSGKMADALSVLDAHITRTDIVPNGLDFLKSLPPVCQHYDAIITNPPYNLAQRFIEHALMHVSDEGMVAMLLRCDFDHAKTRQHLFGQCKQFAKKLVLTKRIKWFEDSTGSPSFNHAWYIWDRRHAGMPVIAYGP